MSNKSCWLITICALLLGVFIGGIFVYLLKPNRFHVQVRGSQKLYILADKGDTIDWVPDRGQATPSVQYFNEQGEIPFCKESGKINHCTVNVSQGHYSYECPDGAPQCIDPGSGGGGSYMSLSGKLREALVAVPVEFYGAIRDVLASRQAPFTGTSIRGASHPPRVYCVNGTTNVDPDPITATAQVESIIQWENGTDNLLVVPITPGMCKEGTQAINADGVCTVPANAKGKVFTYTVTMPGVCTTPVSHSITVQ